MGSSKIPSLALFFFYLGTRFQFSVRSDDLIRFILDIEKAIQISCEGFVEFFFTSGGDRDWVFRFIIWIFP